MPVSTRSEPLEDTTVLHWLKLLNEGSAGRDRVARLVLAATLCGGHVLLEDWPGTGKTTLAKSLSKAIGLRMRRLQGTSDLLPSDIVGVNVYDRNSSVFHFHQGPVFTNILLCDEINRCPPRTQSALLEAMAEYQVTLDGVTSDLPDPFMVIATQNPLDGNGTLDLPAAQWDRFMFKLSLGPIEPTREKLLITQTESQRSRKRPISSQFGVSVEDGLPVSSHVENPRPPDAFLAARNVVTAVHVSPAIANYIWRLLDASRKTYSSRGGLSTRAGHALVSSSRAMAFLAGRNHVIPEDVESVFMPVALHRLLPADHVNEASSVAGVREMFDSIALDL